MKKKVIILLCLIFICSLLPMGMKFAKRRCHNAYMHYLSSIDFIFRDKNILNNAREYNQDMKNKRKMWHDYYQRSLKLNSKNFINTRTAYFFTQGNHPDVLFFEDGLGGYNYWMAFTAYPFSNDRYENPHVIVSRDGSDFYTPEGLKNPVVPPPEDAKEGGHLSDTDLVYDKGRFMLYYVYNKKGVKGPSKFYRVESSDGVKWDKPHLIYESKETIEGYSPAVLAEKDKLKMWYVGGEGNFVYTESKDNGSTWNKVIKCNLKADTWLPWHVDIIKTEKGYEGLLCAKSKEIPTRALFYIFSEDGLNWSISKYPIIFPNRRGWDNTEIYRSTFVKDKGEYKIWYSARSGYKKWHIGQTRATEEQINSLDMIK